MQAGVSFIEYVRVGTPPSVFAKFSDPMGESNGSFLTKAECETRLANLKSNDFPYQETENAIAGWPDK
jgi:hypothetical protein